MKILSEELFKNIEKTQFLITTHSLEFAEELVKQIKLTNNADHVQIVRMSRDLMGIEREILYLEDIEEELSLLRVDLRGY
jgi:predicted ATP-dependent endonuclease of OLD family